MWQSYVDEGCTDPMVMLNNSVCSGYILKFEKMVGNINPYALEYPACVTSQQQYISNFMHYDSFKSNLLNDQVVTYEPCEEDYAIAYLNNNEVKKALHVRTDIQWLDCSRTTKYSTADRMKSTKHIYKELLLNKNWPNFRMMVYYGDVDSVCSHSYAKWLFDLGFVANHKNQDHENSQMLLVYSALRFLRMPEHKAPSHAARYNNLHIHTHVL